MTHHYIRRGTGRPNNTWRRDDLWYVNSRMQDYSWRKIKTTAQNRAEDGGEWGPSPMLHPPGWPGLESRVDYLQMGR